MRYQALLKIVNMVMLHLKSGYQRSDLNANGMYRISCSGLVYLWGRSMIVPSSLAEFYADSDGRTALHWAVDRGHLHAVELLVSKGAQINAKVRYAF